MEFSLPAWLGALVGTIVAVAIYLPGIRVLETRLRLPDRAPDAAQRSAFEEKLSVLRRVILGLDIAILATIGYWIANAFWPAGAGHPQF